MSLFLKDRWLDWARDWGLTHHPEKGWIYRTECVVGERKGLLVKAWWGRDEAPGLTVCLRFPRNADPIRLRKALIEDPALDVLPGGPGSRRKMFLETGTSKAMRLARLPEFTLKDHSLVWRHVFAWSVPAPSRIQAWVDLLVDAVGRATPVFDGRCETCGTAVGPGFVLVDGLPTLMCPTCRQKVEAAGEMAERTYDLMEARHLNGTLFASVAAVVGAVAWAGIAAITEREFAIAAIGIGVLVAWAYKRGAGRVDRAGQAIGAGLTLASVVVGEILLYAWWVARANPGVGFRLEAGLFVYVQAWQKSAGSEVITLFLGLVGAWIASKGLERPKLRQKIEDASSPAAGERRAA
jgi:hypothetical protein